MKKPHLHILQRRDVLSQIALVESPTVAEVFKITKSSQLHPDSV